MGSEKVTSDAIVLLNQINSIFSVVLVHVSLSIDKEYFFRIYMIYQYCMFLYKLDIYDLFLQLFILNSRLFHGLKDRSFPATADTRQPEQELISRTNNEHVSCRTEPFFAFMMDTTLPKKNQEIHCTSECTSDISRFSVFTGLSICHSVNKKY